MPNTYTELRRTVVGTATPTVTFDLTGISGYTDLVMVYAPLGSTNTVTHSMRLNGDTASNYSYSAIRGDGSSASSFRASNQTSLTMYPQDYDNTTVPSVIIVNFQNYANTTTFKTILWRAGMSASGQGTSALVGLWRKTPEAITSITLTSTGNFAVGSTFSLYGIANADQGAAKATGGIITEDSQYWYHTFGASGAFIPKQSLTCDYLILAGGGGGGNYNGGGGGGGGGYISGTGSFTATTYNITIGGGGASASAQGSNSTFNSLTAVGGGGGAGGGAGGAGTTGGSGGGGGGTTGATSGLASSASGQGFAGGNAYYDGSNTRRGGGGGGATTVGVAATSSTNGAGNGGTGLTSSINGFSIVYAAGGGGGGHGTDSSAGLGTTNVSGNGGSTAANPTNGTVNTGGGGGGGGGDRNVIGTGGSGVVIVRYAK